MRQYRGGGEGLAWPLREPVTVFLSHDVVQFQTCCAYGKSVCFRTKPELKLLQIKYEELTERKSSLTEATWFLSSLKQLHHDYAALKRKTPTEKEKVSVA